ncbi:class I SAM-dependent methyltransferase [Chloroflexota bacterium]
MRCYPDSTVREKLWIFAHFLVLPFRDIDRWIGESDSIADLGCGYGVMANVLLKISPKRSIYGVDLSAGRIARASATKWLSTTQFSVADVTDPALYKIKQKFDVVLISEVMYQLSPGNQEQVLEYVTSILAPDGKLIIKDYTTRPRFKYCIFWLQTNLLFWLVSSTRSIALKLGKLGRPLLLIETTLGIRENLTILSRDQYAAMFARKGWLILSNTLPNRGLWPHCLFVCSRENGKVVQL